MFSSKTTYTGVNKRLKKSITAGKYKFMKDLATGTEKAARVGNMQRLYYATKKIQGSRLRLECKTVPEIQEQRNRWAKHF